MHDGRLSVGVVWDEVALASEKTKREDACYWAEALRLL